MDNAFKGSHGTCTMPAPLAAMCAPPGVPAMTQWHSRPAAILDFKGELSVDFIFGPLQGRFDLSTSELIGMASANGLQGATAMLGTNRFRQSANLAVDSSDLERG